VNVNTAQFQAITERVAQLEATVARLEARLYQATAAEEVLRRAGYDEPIPRPAPRRPRHLKAIR
jgi:hypothetical protein